MIRKGRPWYKHRDKILDFTREFALALQFHWTPEQIRSMDEDIKMQYIAILTGREQGRKEKGEK